MSKTFDIKIRKGWGDMSPVSRIHGEGKEARKPKFNKRDRKNWKKALDY